MALSIEGRISEILPIESGTSSRGEWKKRIFVIETLEQFPRKVAFVTWNERAEALDKLKRGMRVVVQFSLESREFNGKWYTDARAFAIKMVEEKDVVGPSRPGASNASTSDTTTQDIDTEAWDGISEDSNGEFDDNSDLLNDNLSTDDNSDLLDDTFPEDDAEDLFSEKDEDTDDLPF